MTLKEYHTTTGVTYAHIARLCGVSGAAVSQIANGYVTPTFGLAVKIEKATGGHVGRDNWYPSQP